MYQQQQGDAVYRAQVHAAVDTLLDDVEAQMPDSTEDLPSLFTLTETVRAERGRLSGTIVQAYVERTYETYLHRDRATVRTVDARSKPVRLVPVRSRRWWAR